MLVNLGSSKVWSQGTKNGGNDKHKKKMPVASVGLTGKAHNVMKESLVWSTSSVNLQEYADSGYGLVAQFQQSDAMPFATNA